MSVKSKKRNEVLDKRDSKQFFMILAIVVVVIVFMLYQMYKSM